VGGTVKAALTGLITKAATDYLQNRFVDRFAGHNEEYPGADLEYESGYEKTGYERDSELFR
jgi:hypothetical protein